MSCQIKRPRLSSFEDEPTLYTNGENGGDDNEEEGEDIVFLRKLIIGEANKSYGVQVARLAGLPDAVVRRAGEIMKELEDHSVLNHIPEPPKNTKSNDRLI